uniref:Ribonuclease H-like domain-containing protein n=1 Tax=Tanacetum cinerariifolium TaxID=118510 RepID=A0A6L2MH12_TANCI|nr:ribonuclease H-like domain-containing protein [Tanacetum cinerariifolium]
MPTDPHCTPTILQPSSSQPQKTQKPRKPKRKDTQVPQPSGPTNNVVDEAVHKELGDRLVRVATTASSIEADQDSGGPMCQETIRDTTAQTRVLDLEQTKTTQKNEIDGLKMMVKKLEKRNRSRTYKLKRLYKVGLTAMVESSGDEEILVEDASKQGRRIDAIDVNEDITLVNDVDNEMFDVDDLGGEEVFIAGHNKNVVEEVVNTAQLAERLQEKEQEELSDAEKATLFQQLLKKTRKHFAAKRAKEKRNKPPIKAQQRKIMYTYLKNMEGYKLKNLKLKEFDSIQEMFDKAFKREVIVNGDAPALITSVSGGSEAAIPPKTTKQKIARRNELKAKSTLLLAILEGHLLKFHGIKDAKTLWEEIKTSQLEIHSEVILQKDGNLKLLRSLPSAWNTHTLIMRNKSDLDTLCMDDLYNNLKVYEAEIKGESNSNSSSNSQNVAFVSLDNTSSTNEAVNTAHDVSAASLQGKAFASTYLEQIDTDDLEEIDLKWQVAMLTMRVKRFIKKTGRNLNFNGKETVGFDKTKVKCYNFHNRGHFAREYRASMSQRNKNGDITRKVIPVETPAKALVVTDGMGSDWSYQAEEGPTDFALMAFSSSGSSSSDTKREILNKANLEIIAYQLGLESLKARIVVHQNNEAVFEEDITFLKYDIKVRDNSITELKNQLKESLKEKDDLKLKLEKFKTSFKNLTNLINSQISPKDKNGLDYDSQLNERHLNNKSDVFESAYDSSVNESEDDNNQANDRYKAGEGYHEVPSPYTGNFMPPRPDLFFARLDDSIFKFAISETVTSVHETETSASKTSKESMEKLKFVRPSAPIIEYWSLIVMITRPTGNVIDHISKDSGSYMLKRFNYVDLQGRLKHMTGNNSFLTDYQEFDGGFVAFRGSPKGGKIFRKGNIRTGKLDFEDVYFVKELKFNLFSISQMCDKKNSVLFTETECLVQSPDFKLLDENQSSNDKDVDEAPGKEDEGVSKESGIDNHEKFDSSTQDVNTAKPSNNTANTNINTGSLNINIVGSNDPSMPSLEESNIFDDVYDYREVGADADTNNLELSTIISHIPITRLASLTSKEEQIIKIIRTAYLPVFSLNKNPKRIEAIKLFLAYASFMRFIVYQMDVKSAFLYGIIEEEVYVYQPPGFEDPHFPNKVYKVEKALYGLHQALRAWYETLSTYLLENGFKRDDAQEIINKFYRGTHFLLRITASTLMEPNKALIKDTEAEDVDVHLYRSMIRSLMYLIASRPDIMFVVCACLWYPRDLPFHLKAFSDSDYAEASFDRKSTTGEMGFVMNLEFKLVVGQRLVKQSSMDGFGEMITTVI